MERANENFLSFFEEKTGQRVSVGEKIKCINPKHEDNTPSMQIYPTNAYCFGCNFYLSAKEKKKISRRDFVRKRFIELCQDEDISSFSEQRRYNLSILKELQIGKCTSEVMEQLFQEFSKKDMDSAGITKSNHHVFINRIIIPYTEAYFSARAENKFITEKKNLFLAGDKKQLYIIPGKEITILCEGETDAVALRHIYPEYEIIGLGGVSENSLKILEEAQLQEEVWLCFDNDEAGRKADFEATKILEDYNLKRISFDTKYKDIDEVYRNYLQDTVNQLKIISIEKKDVLIEDDFKPLTKAEYKAVILENFPNMWPVVDACVSVICILKLEKWSDCVGLNLVGPPSSEKTTVLSFFYGIDGLIFKSDNFTPKCFVTHAANLPEQELKAVDLLPKIKDKTIIIPELAPIFGKRKEDLLENMSILTRVFDGEGYESDSGIRGHRGYSGEYLFTWLGATTPLSTGCWNTMGKLGSRFFFLYIPKKKNTAATLREIVSGDGSYTTKLKECRQATNQFLKSVFFDGKKRNIVWDFSKNEEICEKVIPNCAAILARFRAAIEFWSEGNEFQFKKPLAEEPYRIANVLTNVAKGHAISEGRNCLTKEDLPVVVSIAISSMPENRRALLEIILKNLDRDYFTAEWAEEELNCSNKHALSLLETLRVLGVFHKEDISVEDQGRGRPQILYRLERVLKEDLESISIFLPKNDSVVQENKTEETIILPKSDSVGLVDTFENKESEVVIPKRIISTLSNSGNKSIKDKIISLLTIIPAFEEDVYEQLQEEYSREEYDCAVRKLKEDGDLSTPSPGKIAKP